MFARYYASERHGDIFDGLVVQNLEAGEVVATYETLSFHYVHLFGSLVRLGVLDPFDLRYQSSESFPYLLSETDSEVAGYGSKHCHCRKDRLAERLYSHRRPPGCAVWSRCKI